MALKFLLIVIIFYLIVRAAMNMWKAIQNDPAGRRSESWNDAEPRRHVNGRTYETVLGSTQRPTPARRDVVEDARFTDV